jgi:hypothetical protein
MAIINSSNMSGADLAAAIDQALGEKYTVENYHIYSLMEKTDASEQTRQAAGRPPQEWGPSITYKTNPPFAHHLEEAAKQPDPAAALRGSMVDALMADHPTLTRERAEELLAAFGA